MNVAVESAAQPHRVVFPRLVGPQVETEFGPGVLQMQAERRPHLEEHGRQLLDVEDVCGTRRRRTFKLPQVYSIADSEIPG